MLAQRVLTAIVLLALLLPAMLADSMWPFAVLTLLLIGAAGWEWGRLNGASFALALSFGLALVAACAGSWWAGWTARAPAGAWALAGAVWVFGASAALRAGVAGWPRVPTLARWCLGLVALWAAWLALATAKARGLNFMLSVFCLVWVADIAAYFGGRRFGKRKLAPAISPGKSWAGAYSGGLAGVLLALLWLALERSRGIAPGGAAASLYGRLDAQWGIVGMAAAVVFLVAMSVVGDLFESLVKRSASAKDSSRLLPGHGGVLDRVDALLPVFPLALALSSW